MSAADVVPPAPDTLLALHQRWLSRYKEELRAARPSGPVFLLELAVSDDELTVADRLLRPALRARPLREASRVFWNQRYLPLLRVATEVGYLYQGTGTEYWPVLGRRLGVDFPHEARQELRHLYDAFAASSEVRVPDTPWGAHFPNIARPVTHAILPRELHAPLLSALLAADIRRLRREGWATLESALLEQAAQSRGRLPHFLRQGPVAEAVVRALAFEQLQSEHVAEHALRRIRADVLQTDASRRLLRQVVERAREAPAPSPSRPARRSGGEEASQVCALLLVRDERRLSLDVQIPATSFALSEARRRPIRLLGGGRTIAVDHLVLGGREPLQMDLSAGAAGERPLLRPEDAEAVADGALRRHLAALRIDLSAPVLLAEHLGPSGTARQVRERAFVARDGYWLLSAEEPDDLPREAEPHPQRVCGLSATRLDARSPAVQRWLQARGLKLKVEPKVQRLGAPPLGGRGAWESGLVAGDLLLLQVEDEPVPVAGRAEPLAPGLWRCALPAAPARWEARLGVGAGLVLETPIRDRAPPPAPAVEIASDEAAPTLDALLQRRLCARIWSALPLAGLRARLCLEGPEGLLVEAETEPLPALPAAIPSDDPCWAALAGALDDLPEQPARGGSRRRSSASRERT